VSEREFSLVSALIAELPKRVRDGAHGPTAPLPTITPVPRD